METICTYHGPGNETVAEIHDDDLMVEFADTGEGKCGDYDPSDPDDVELIRFHVYRKAGPEWEPVDGASYCTCIAVNTPEPEIRGLLADFLAEYRNAVIDEAMSVKKLGERLSWTGYDRF